jgi:hypothetical protein
MPETVPVAGLREVQAGTGKGRHVRARLGRGRPGHLVQCTTFVSLASSRPQTRPAGDLLVRFRLGRLEVACRPSMADLSGQVVCRMRSAVSLRLPGAQISSCSASACLNVVSPAPLLLRLACCRKTATQACIVTCCCPSRSRTSLSTRAHTRQLMSSLSKSETTELSPHHP